jgi:hypothetical protein
MQPTVKVINHVCDICGQEDVPVALLGPVAPRLAACEGCLTFALDAVRHAEADAQEMGADLTQNRLVYTASFGGSVPPVSLPTPGCVGSSL